MSFQDVMREISQFLGTPLYTTGGTQGTVGTALTVAFMILVTWWLSLLLSKAILRAFKRRKVRLLTGTRVQQVETISGMAVRIRAALLR